MTANNGTNIKRLLNLHVPGTVLSASWLADRGFSYDLQQYYRKSGWLESIGTGAFKRPIETVDWSGALYTLQQRLKLPVHPGGLTAITVAWRFALPAHRQFSFSFVHALGNQEKLLALKAI